MAKDFCERFAASREAFEEASEALGLDMAALCFEDNPQLDLTEFTQPAIVTAEIAMLRGLSSELGFRPAWYGGHSLGEYAALCAAGVMPLGVAVRLVRRRGALMQAAVPSGEGAMAAVIAPGIADRDLASIAALGVDVANWNSVEQIVLSGPTAAVERATAYVETMLAGTKHEVIQLNVSAPFHSAMMRCIEPELRAAIEDVSAEIVAARAKVVTSNLTGDFHDGTMAGLVEGLVRQASSPVEWIANMRALARVASDVYEVGPNRPLRAFFRTVGLDVKPIISVRTAEKAFAAA
jgi:[acyl-carrier-protein] S-malonyltransferase/trans-AT polyketide synthase/acyltransferase/oxidoreductase domain-containing protein